ncbi:MAG: 2-polyprenyl-3-methyl-6-methoxy-1,4-benzoquinone monooxygenase [Steroidobacterales bacterium]
MSTGLTLDGLLEAADGALRTLFAPAHAERNPPLPAAEPLSEGDRRRAAGLMRVNHAGEVAAQGLYRGQAMLSRSPATRALLQRAAAEEGDHLAWCEARLRELDARPSRLNPFWYLGSLALGAVAAALDDRISLGFVAETERQVEGHLSAHLRRLPAADARSRKIVELMRDDEIRHGQTASQAGAAALPAVVSALMRAASKVMTGTAYWI